MGVITILLVVLLAFYSFNSLSATQSEAFFCKQCTSKEVARTIAKNEHINPKKCYPENPNRPMSFDNMICGSVHKDVVLVNPDTKAVYSFLLGHSKVAPMFSALALDRELNQSQIEGYQAVVDYNAALNYAVSNIQNHTVYKNGSNYISSSESCPDDTALSILVDPNKMELLKDLMTTSLMLNLKNSPTSGVLDAMDDSGRVATNSVGINFRGVNYSLQYTEQTKKPFIVWEFEQSEKVSSFKDALVFNIEFYAYNSNNVPLIRYSVVDEASRAAGMSLSSLKGSEFGPSIIENASTLDKLAELNETGTFTNSNGGTLGFNGSGGATNTVINGVGGSGATCTVVFVQQGTGDSYTFRLPRSMCN